MRLSWSFVAALGIPFLANCTPTPPPGGASAVGGCTFPASQTSVDVRVACTLSGPLPNRLVDPVSGGSGCTLTSFSLSGQRVSATATLIYGENGDDNDARVRIGGLIGAAAPSTHRGNIAKTSPDCASIVPPTVPVSTSFAGRHIALIDKGQTPMCVFQSRFGFTSFNQTIGSGLAANVSAASRAALQEMMGQMIDLEAARAVNGLLRPAANVNEPGFVARSGRCADGHTTFVGS